MAFFDRWEIGKLFSDGSSLNNHKYRDHRRWVIGLGFCDRWGDGKGFSGRISLKNHQSDTYIGLVFG